MDGNEQRLLSQYERTFSQDSTLMTEPTKDKNVFTTDDLTKFLKLINEATTKTGNVSSTSTTNERTELFEDNDEEVFYCPYSQETISKSKRS